LEFPIKQLRVASSCDLQTTIQDQTNDDHLMHLSKSNNFCIKHCSVKVLFLRYMFVTLCGGHYNRSQ